MASERNPFSGNTTMLVLKLLDEKDMYGYQIIEELARRSDDTFCFKTGTLYPILHGLENDSMVSSYDETAENTKVRKYYHITDKGKGLLAKKQTEWKEYTKAVNSIMKGGVCYALS